MDGWGALTKNEQKTEEIFEQEVPKKKPETK